MCVHGEGVVCGEDCFGMECVGRGINAKQFTSHVCVLMYLALLCADNHYHTTSVQTKTNKKGETKFSERWHILATKH